MAFLQCLFCTLICYFVGVCAEECPQRQLTDSQRLRRDVFCNYDKTALPMKSTNVKTEVMLTFILKEFTFYTYVDELTVHFFSVIRWTDKSLTWNHTSYGGISKLLVDSNSIWMPEIAVVNPNRMSESETNFLGAQCILIENGLVHCAVASSFSTTCSADMTNWPYDSQSCKALVKPWTRSTDDLNLFVYSSFGNNSMMHKDFYFSNKEWDLQEAKFMKVASQFENSTYSYIEITMKMKRHGNLYEATVVLPGLVIAVVTLLSFWMQSDTDTRFCLCSTAIVLDCFYLQYLGFSLHQNGASCPLIVLLYRDHLLVSAAALLMALIVRWMYSTELEVPIMATSIVHPIYTSRSASWLLLVDPTKDAAEEKNKQWLPVAVLLDRLSFVAFSITFLILFIVCFST